ncbi:MAG: tripartite tricarboxylate transporter substrate binding protein [Alphaproteobacteria bacterium]|nr:tripartite tricarboxylate transporter substrate binding protein [Alphaproteobacteria bacterium]
MNKRALSFAAAMAAGLFCQTAFAQDYPAKNIRFISPGPPGSTTDIMPRVIAPELGRRLGATVVVENRVGGSGLVSASALVNAPADGATIWLGTMGTLCINPHVMPSMPFDQNTAVTPVSLTATLPLILVVNPKTTPVKNVKEFIEFLRKNPQQGTYGSPGPGSTGAITGAMFGNSAGLNLTHVSYRGMLPAADAVIKGELGFLISDIGVITAKVADGSLRALAATTAKRSELMPDVPSFSEQGINMDVALWYGVFVRSGTPKPVLDRLNKEFAEIMKLPEIAARWKNLGLSVGGMEGAEFDKYYREELARWAKVVPPLGIKGK